MKRKKHKPPSRERYEKNNPVWSVRMPKAWIEELEAELKANGQSRRDFLAIALEKQALNAEEIRVTWRKKGESQGYEKGHEDGDKNGYTRGMDEWAIWVYCYNCLKPFYIKQGSQDHKELIEIIQGHLKHPKCPEK